MSANIWGGALETLADVCLQSLIAGSDFAGCLVFFLAFLAHPHALSLSLMYKQ